MIDGHVIPHRSENTNTPAVGSDKSGKDTWSARLNPRLVFTDPDAFFGREFYQDLLMEQQEQQG